MPIAFSPDRSKLHLTDIDASTPATLRAGLHDAVLASGWTVVRAITDGVIYELTSPQSEDEPLLCRVRIQDTGRLIYGTFITGTLDVVDLQFMSADEESQGYSHWIACESLRTLKVHTNPCQIFIWHPEGDSFGRGRNVCGGIPYVDPRTIEGSPARDDCETGTARTNACWWSHGDTDQFDPLHTFRTHYRTYLGYWSAYWNGTLINSEDPQEGYEAKASVRVLPAVPANPILLDERTNLGLDGTPEAASRWRDSERPLAIEPVLVWWHLLPTRYIGLIWDAFLATSDVEEDEVTGGEDTWVNYSKASAGNTYPTTTYYSSLFLLTNAAAPLTPAEVNVAY